MYNHENHDEREKGQSIVIVTLVIVIVLAVSGLTIDVGRLYMTRQQLQGYADAATLAGARRLPYGTEGTALRKQQIDAAVFEALQTYALNVGVNLNTIPAPGTSGYSYSPAWNPSDPDQENLTYSIDFVHSVGGDMVTDHVVVTVLLSDALTTARNIAKERAMMVEAERDVPMIFGSLLGPPVAKAGRPAAGFKNAFEVKWKFNTAADVHGTPQYGVDRDGKEVVITVSKSGYVFALDAIGEEATGRTWAYWKYKPLEAGAGERTLCFPYTSKYACEPTTTSDVEANYAVIGSPTIVPRISPPEYCTYNGSNCSDSNGDFDYTVLSAHDNGDGTTTLAVKVCNACSNALSNVAISLPAGQPASWPSNGATYVAFKSYTVENTTNNPFYSIKYNTIGEGIKNGQCDIFRFTLPTGVAQYGLNVEAKASTKVDQRSFTGDCAFRPTVDMGQDLAIFASYPKGDDAAAKRGYLYALNLMDGSRVWASYVGQRKYQMGAYSGGNEGTVAGNPFIDATPAFSPDGTIVYYPSRDGRLYAFYVKDGTAVWPDCETADSLVNSCVTLAAGMIATPAVDPSTGTIFVATSRRKDSSGSGSPVSDRGVLYAINSDGTIKWTWYPGRSGYGFDSSPRLFPANNPDALYIGNRDGYVYKVNPSNGASVWEWQPPGTIAPDGQPGGNPRGPISATPLVVEEAGQRYIYVDTEFGAGFKLQDGSSPTVTWSVWLGYDVNTQSSPPGGGNSPTVRRAVHMSPGVTTDFVYFGVVTKWDQQCAFQAVRRTDGRIMQSFVMDNDTHSTLRVAPNNWLYYASCDNYTYGVDTNPNALDSRLIR